MRRARKGAALTTLTEGVAHDFLQHAEPGEKKFCKLIPGFHLIKQKRGSAWRWRYADDLGKRPTATVGKYGELNPQEAAQIVLDWIREGVDPLKEMAARQASSRKAAQDRAQRTLRAYLDNYYRPYMDRSWKPENAQANYNRISNRFAMLLDRDMMSIDKADIDSWQRETEIKGRAFGTVRRDYGALKTLLNRAAQDKVIPVNPLAVHKLLDPTLRDQSRTLSGDLKAERRLLTDDEIKGILTGLDVFGEEVRQQRRNSRKHGKPYLPDLDKVNYPHWFIPFCHLAIHSGLRPGDIYTLTWQELNIRFARLTKVCEKTSHAARRQKKPATVDMKLNPTILAVMADWHTDNGEPDTGLVFPSPRTGDVMDRKAHNKPWRSVKKAGEVSANLNFYALRHHFISALMAANVSIFTVAKLAGHKSVEMIMEHYGHLCPNQATEALDIVARSVAVDEKNSRNSG